MYSHLELRNLKSHMKSICPLTSNLRLNLYAKSVDSRFLLYSYFSLCVIKKLYSGTLEYFASRQSLDQ